MDEVMDFTPTREQLEAIKPESSLMRNFLKINGAQDLSLKAPVSNTFKPINGVSDDNILPFRDVVVNSDLPHIFSLYEGLTPYQSGQLDKALKTGLSKTNAKAGSLESLNKVKQEINEMISKVQLTDKTSEVW